MGSVVGISRIWEPAPFQDVGEGWEIIDYDVKQALERSKFEGVKKTKLNISSCKIIKSP